MRELEANIETVAHNCIIVMTATMMVVAGIELVAWRKISIKANPVGGSNARSRSPIANKVAINRANPSKPFERYVNTMARGTMIGAF